MRSEKMTSQGCPANPAGAALLPPQPTARNQSETRRVDLSLQGHHGIVLPALEHLKKSTQLQQWRSKALLPTAS